MCVGVCVLMHVCVCIYVYLCMYVCLCVFVCLYIQMYTVCVNVYVQYVYIWRVYRVYVNVIKTKTKRTESTTEQLNTAETFYANSAS